MINHDEISNHLEGESMEQEILNALQDNVAPMSLNALLKKLDVSLFDIQVRDLVWKLIDQGDIRFTPDRKLQYLKRR